VPFIVGTPKVRPVKTANIKVPEMVVNQQILRYSN
jgi:hypothetical protein